LSSSVFNYWFGYVSNVTLVIWLASRAVTGGVSQLSAMGWVASIAGGLFLWTLSEYFLHKWLYHDIGSPIRDGHTMHHDEPHALLGVPWYLTLVVIVGVYYGLARFMNPAATGVVMASLWLGYIGYCAMHHLIHHSRMTNAWFMNLRRHHLLHHAKNNVNWGITTDFWDKVFRTKV
jgi:sterol desaturase/sphingolipid hydroxylase (fatty acid hydroxylase superfamily)